MPARVPVKHHRPTRETAEPAGPASYPPIPTCGAGLPFGNLSPILSPVRRNALPARWAVLPTVEPTLPAVLSVACTAFRVVLFVACTTFLVVLSVACTALSVVFSTFWTTPPLDTALFWSVASDGLCAWADKPHAAALISRTADSARIPLGILIMIEFLLTAIRYLAWCEVP